MPRPRRALAAVDTNKDVSVEINQQPTKLAAPEKKTTKARKGKKNTKAKVSDGAQNQDLLNIQKQQMEKEAELKNQKEENERLASQNVQLSEQIASLTEMLSKSSIQKEAKPASVAISNPFGGALPIVSAPTQLKPKRNLTAFQHYSSSTRESFKEQNPDVPAGQVGQELKEIWDAAGDDIKAPFEEMATTDKLRYETQKAEYDQNMTELERRRRAVEWMEQEKKTALALEFYEKEMAKAPVKPLPSKAPKNSISLPKRPLTLWNCFLKESHKKLAAEAEKTGSNVHTISMAELTTQCSSEWKRIQASRKKVDKVAVESIKKLALSDQKRYQDEMRVYNAKISERRRSAVSKAEQYEEEALKSYAAKENENMLIEQGKQAEANKRIAMKEEKKEARAAKIASREAKAARPKGARSAYNFYMKEMLPLIREKNSSSAKEAMSEVSRLWKEISDEDKKQYTALAEEDKERFESEKAAASAESEPTAEDMDCSPLATF